jgi:hypothetical protein
MAFLSAQVRGDRCKTLTKGTRPGFSTVRPRAIAKFLPHALEVASPLRRRACAKFAIKDCLDAMFIVGVRVPIDSLGWGGGRGIAV